jgi:hypothetical protein
MTIKEPKCVALKRKGAEYVATLLSGKSEEEIIAFWAEKTKKLKSINKNKSSKPN